MMCIIDNVFALMFCSLKFFGDFGTNHMGGKLIFVGCDGGSIFKRRVGVRSGVMTHMKEKVAIVCLIVHYFHVELIWPFLCKLFMVAH